MTLTMENVGEDDVQAAVGRHYSIRSSAIIDLNLLRVRISSNLARFDGYAYFSKFVEAPSGTEVFDYEVVCVDLAEDPVDLELVRPLVDRTFRADRFRSGFYLTHHFGPPAYLVTRGNRIHVFGHDLHRLIWPYFVKHLLTVFAVDHDLVHLKAAALVQPQAGATLLFGRGGGGKTVFLTAACAAGARFLSNTHVLTRGDTVYGVPSAMRVRRDGCFGELITRGRLERHLEAGEYRVDPAVLFGGEALTEAPVRTVCIVDYRPDRPFRCDEVPVEDFAAFVELFGFAIGTYGLKDDVLAHLDGDFGRYAAAYGGMKARMSSLLSNSRRLYVNADMLDPAVRDTVLSTLAE